MRTSNQTSSRSLLVALAALTALSGCRIEKPATVVPAPPAVDTFTASATEVARGTKITLSWTTSNAQSIELREAASGELAAPVDSVQGTFEVTIDRASLFVLVARGAGGSDARAVSVTVTDEAGTDFTFQALPPVINGGGSSTLVWSAPGATTVTLTAGSVPVNLSGQRASGAVTVAPSFDTRYTLTANGVMKTVDVAVEPAVLSADVSPRAVEVADTVTLRWTAAGADKVVVSSPGRGQLFETTTPAAVVSGSFSDVVPPTPNDGIVSYEIAAVKGTTRVTRTLEVSVGTGLAITRFTAPPVAGAGASYGVRWETRAADQVELKVDGVTVHQTGSKQAAAAGSFTFTAPALDFAVELVATNTRGARTSQVLQVDAVGVPTTASLTANPTTVAIGQPVTLTFNSAEARRVRITDAAGQVVFSVTGQVAENGTATVYPGADTTYTLAADNLLGNPAVTATAAVTVTGTPVTVTQFPPTALSGQNVTLNAPVGSLLYGFPHAQVLPSSQADFRDISATGTRVLEAPANVATVSLPFTTFLWGQRQSGPLTVSRAGWMAWGASLAVNSSNASSLPSSSGAPGLIAPFWDDLTLVAGTSNVFAQVVGSAPEETLVVQWDKLRVGTDAATEVTFQVQVHQRGMVSFQYRTMTLASAYSSFLVGVQDPTRLAGLRSSATPASNSALYFFSPVAPPIELRVFKGMTWGGTVKQGNLFAEVSRPAGAYLVPSDLSVTELMFRPDPAVPAGQYLEVMNRTSGPLDLSGWELRAVGTPTFSVPAGFTLQPNVPTVIGASSDPAQNDDAGVTLSWGASGFTLSPDAGTLVMGTADAGVSLAYRGPADGGFGQSTEFDPGPFVGTSGSPGPAACPSTGLFGGQTPQQRGSPGAERNCGFPYSMQVIPSKFVDISDGGTALVNSTSTVDYLTVPVTLALSGADPAPVAFGVRREVLSMCLDGWLVWGSTTDTNGSNASTTSTTSSTLGKLAPFWDDMKTVPSRTPRSEMFWKRFAANEDPQTPAQHWVFQWARVSQYFASPVDDLNFEVKLFEDGTIEYHYGAMLSGDSSNYADGNSATAWLESPVGDQALVISINQPLIRPNTAFRFTPR